MKISKQKGSRFPKRKRQRIVTLHQLEEFALGRPMSPLERSAIEDRRLTPEELKGLRDRRIANADRARRGQIDHQLHGDVRGTSRFVDGKRVRVSALQVAQEAMGRTTASAGFLRASARRMARFARRAQRLGLPLSAMPRHVREAAERVAQATANG